MRPAAGTPGPGGYAAILRQIEGGEEVKKATVKGDEDHTTNSRMELTAAIRELARPAKAEPLPIIVRSDSQFLVKCMTEWLPGWIERGWRRADKKPVENVDLWQELVRLTQGKQVTFDWVRGHNGDVYNEEADRLEVAEAKKREVPVCG
jgi:ribonuclease HI